MSHIWADAQGSTKMTENTVAFTKILFPTLKNYGLTFFTVVPGIGADE